MEGHICICIYTYLSNTVPLKFTLIKTMFSDVDKDKFEDGVKITLYLSRLSCAQDLRFFCESRAAQISFLQFVQ